MDIARSAGYDGAIEFACLVFNCILPATIPAQNGLSGPATPIDASALFQQADLISGFMDIEINNQLPTDLHNVTFQLKNLGAFGNTNVVLLATIPFIPKYTTTDTSFSMAGATIESDMEGQLISMDVDSIPAGTLIDTLNQFIEIKIKLREMKAQSATAVFPEQTVLNTIGNVKYYFPNNIKITQMSIESGDLLVSAVNTVQNPIEFIYALPTSKRFGVPVSVTTFLVAAPPGGSTTVDTVVALSGVSSDLTVQGDSFNTFPQMLIGNMKYTGNLVTMTLQDSIKIFYALKDIVPSYVEGYLGLSTFSFAGGQKLDFFKSIKSGTLDLENPSLKITFGNSIGVDGEVRVNSIKGFNTRTGQNITLTASALSGTVMIPGPRLPNVGQTLSFKMTLDKNNSNVRSFISMLPDSLYYDLTVEANKTGVPSLLNNFATNKSKISAVMDMEVPVHGMSDQLTLGTDLALDIAGANLTDKILDGTLHLFVENYYPFQATTQIYFMDLAGNILDSLFMPGDNNVIAAGVVNQDGIVEQATVSDVTAFYNNYRLTRLRTLSKKASIVFKLDSKPQGQPVKVYSTYKLEFKLTGDFTYKVGKD